MNPFILVTFLLVILTKTHAQNLNQEIILENTPPFLVGHINVKGLSSNSYQTWYESNYEAYEVDTKTIAPLKQNLTDYKILVFMGTWCGDSKREVPRFLKILKTVDFPMENLKIVAVDKRKDKYKKSPTGEEWGLRIKRVPTFIFLKNGKETNRIIENPITSLEADIKKIVNNEAYLPNYPKSLHLD